MEISGFFCYLILLEISFEESRGSKTAKFAIFGALNFVNLVNHCKLQTYMGRVMDAEGGGGGPPGGGGGKNFSAAFGGRKISPWGPAPGKGGWSKIFLPGG